MHSWQPCLGPTDSHQTGIKDYNYFHVSCPPCSVRNKHTRYIVLVLHLRLGQRDRLRLVQSRVTRITVSCSFVRTFSCTQKSAFFSRLNGIRAYTQLTNENEIDVKKRSIPWVCTGRREGTNHHSREKELRSWAPRKNLGVFTRLLHQNKVPLEKTNRNGPLLNKPVGLGSRLAHSGAGAAFEDP